MSGNDLEQAQKYFRKAFTRHQAREYAEAESFYKRALKHDPLHLDANYLLGTLYAERRDLPNALKYLRQAAELNPRSHLIQNNLGNLHQMAGQYDKAIACYQRALDAKPDMPEVHNNLGNIYKNREQYAEAEASYRRALALRPDFHECLCNLGSALRSQKQYQEAMACYGKALELSPDYRAAHEGLGICHAELGERDAAIACFNRCLELAPNDNSEVRLRLAQLGAGAVPERYPAAVMLSTYEKKAQNWDADIQRPGMEFLGPQHMRSMLEKLGLPQQRTFDVLDIGCGTGACGEFLRGYAKRLEGVDLSQPMLDQAKHKKLYDKLECADALGYMQECKRSYDLLVASGVLILFGDLAPVFAAAAHLLKPGGAFIFTLYRSETEPVMVRHNLHFAHSANYIKEATQAAGLDVIRLDEDVHEYDQGAAQPGWVVALRRSA